MRQGNGSVRASIAALCLILALNAAVYHRALGSGFAYDDNGIIVQNETIRSLGNAPLLLKEQYWGKVGQYGLYRPAVMFSYALDYAVFGLDPRGYHATNLLLHVLNAFLVYGVVLAVFGGSGLALWAALLFSAHPAHVEAVSGIVGRAELLATGFGLLSWLVVVGADERGRAGALRLRWLTAGSLFLLALLAKENAVALPLLVGAWGAFVARKRLPLGLWCSYLAALLLYLALRLAVLKGLLIPAAGHFFPGTTLASAIPIASTVVVRYLRMLVFPVGLLPVYEQQFRDPRIAEYSAAALTKIVFLLLLALWAARRVRDRRGVSVPAFAVLWFLISIAPVSHLVPIGTPVADRLLYLPALGFCLFLPGLLLERGRTARAALTLATAGCALLAFGQTRIWVDDLTLWSTTVARAPQSILARNNLGALLRERGNVQEAIREHEEAVRLDPGQSRSHVDLGVAYLRAGLPEKAVRSYLRAIALHPRDPIAYYNLGNLYVRRGDLALAERTFKEGLSLNPGHVSLTNNLGVVYLRQERFAEAEEQFRKVLLLDPGHENAARNLARARARAGSASE